MKRLAGKFTFLCDSCGATSLRWEGRCPNCGTWNSLHEFVPPPPGRATTASWVGEQWKEPAELSTIDPSEAPRLPLVSTEMDRVLGGGLVAGSVVLLAGDPGVGKSTLILQTLSDLAMGGQRCLYVSGEESAQQVRLRAQRLGIDGHGLFFLPETDLEAILGHLDRLRPTLATIDSIQTLSSQTNVAAPGTVSQVRECTRRLLEWAKASHVPILLIGHVTKDGSLAGPRALEHMVDVVLHLEGESLSPLRILRSEKNRFGSTHEVGLFEMHEEGLKQISDPSHLLLQERLEGVAGSALVCTIEGSRPLLLEVQALVNPTVFPNPRRVTSGFSFNRLLLVTAVLTKRASFVLGNQDITVNVTGGLRIEEPAADLAMALAIASSDCGQPLLPSLAVLGEIGLAGEVRRVAQLRRRLAEVARLGFHRALIPSSQIEEVQGIADIDILTASDLREAIEKGLRGKRQQLGTRSKSFVGAKLFESSQKP